MVMESNAMDKGASIEGKDGAVEATVRVRAVVSNSSAEEQFPRAQIAEEDGVSVEKSDAIKNEWKILQALENDEDTQTKRRRKKRKRNRKKTRGTVTMNDASADFTDVAHKPDCDDEFVSTTFVRTERNAHQDEIKESNCGRTGRNRRKSNSKSSEGDCESSSVQGGILDENCDETEENARDDDLSIATSAVLMCDATTRDLNGISCAGASKRLDNFTEKAKPYVPSKGKTNQNQNNPEENRKPSGRNRKISQSSEVTSEETASLDGNMVNGCPSAKYDQGKPENVDSSLSVSSGKKKRRRRKKGNRVHDGSIVEGKDASDESFSCTAGSECRQDGQKATKTKERQETSEETLSLEGSIVHTKITKESPSVNFEREKWNAEWVVSTGKNNRNRQSKGNPIHDSPSLEQKHESYPRTPGDERQRNCNKGTMIQDLQTPVNNHRTLKSNDRSTRREPQHRTRKNSANKQRPLYEKYWSLEKVSSGLKRGELVKGVLRINPRNYEFAWVTVAGLKRDVLLEGMLSRNRALNGDIVAMQILPEDNWKVVREELTYNGIISDVKGKNIEDAIKCVEALTLRPSTAHQSPSAAISHESPASSHKDGSIDVNQVPEQFLQRTAKVVFIIDKKHTRVASGQLKPFPYPKDFPDGCFSPTDSRLPRMRIPRKKCPPGLFDRPRDFDNTLFVARIVSWPETSSRDSFLAMGEIARSLGEAGEIEPETEGILLEYGIDSRSFSDEVLACLPQESPWKIPEEELEHRRDFRGDPVFTIDPATARDLDDAVHCKKIKDNVYEVGVHIADVSYFVRRGTSLDEAALGRGTSTYMVQKVVPMLPRRLCEELCSLNPGEDRLTFSVVWQMTDKGEIISDWKGRGIIRSRIKMAYEHAQDMIDKPNRQWNLNELPTIFDGATVEEISTQVKQLHKFAMRLRRNRFENGALRLDQVKVRFDLDQETGLPNGYHVHKLRDANRIIEEFMLLANMAVAHHIYDSFPEKALLRFHPKPHTKLLENLVELCKSFGILFDASSSKAIQKSLAQFSLSSPEREVLVNLTMRPMKNAEYICAGFQEEDQFGHYALNVPLYTHFTSPIRRYADLVVHRILAASLGIDEPLNEESASIDMIAQHCNDRKLAAKRASELSDEMFFGIFVRECGPLEEDGVVLNVMDQSFDVLVPKLGVVKRVYPKFCPGVTGFEFGKGEKGKPPELSLRWSVKLKSNDTTYEGDEVIKIFSQVRVILTTETETESKTTKPFKVVVKLAPKLKCEHEYYISSSPATGTSMKIIRDTDNNPSDSGLPNPSDQVRKKLFDSVQHLNKAQSSEIPLHCKEGNGFIAEQQTPGAEACDSDDVIVESEEDTIKLPNVIDGFIAEQETPGAEACDSDDVIVESEEDRNAIEPVVAGSIVVAEEETCTLSTANNEFSTTADDESDDVIVESDSEAEQN